VTLIVNDGIENSEPSATTIEVLAPLESTERAPTGQARSTVSIFPSCGEPGTPVTLEVTPLTLMREFGGWNFGAEGPLPPISEDIDLGIPGTPPGHLRVRVQGPTGDSAEDFFVPWTASLSSPVQFSLRLQWATPPFSDPGMYALEVGEEHLTSFQVPCPAPDNHPPLAHAGGPSYASSVGAVISFDGSNSSDPDGDALTYSWDFGDDTPMENGAKPEHRYTAAGSYFVTLIVSDGKDSSFPTVGTRSFAVVTVEGVSNRPVVCGAASPSIGVLWPPNHKLIPVSIIGVTQDEPVNGLGDGDSGPDAIGVGTGTVKVRGERSGNADGRVYHIGFTADDGKGGTCTSQVTVCVPHDQGQQKTCIDQGPLFDSTVSP
jgi:PKD domain